MLKENKGYIFMLLAIIILFGFATILLSQSKQNPYLFSKLLIPVTDYIYNQKTVVINTNKNYLLTLNTNKGPIIIELYSLNAPYNVNNVYKLANLNSFDNINIILSNGLANISTKPTDSKVFDEINQNTIGLSPISINDLIKAGYKSDNTVNSIPFTKYSFGVKIDQRDGVKSNFFVVTDSSKSIELNGYDTNIGSVVSGMDLLSSNNLKVLNSSINEK